MAALIRLIHGKVEAASPLLSMRISVNPREATKILKIRKNYENYAGVEVPHYEGIDFEKFEYSLVETPPWLDSMVSGLRSAMEAHVKVDIAKEKKDALEREWREVSIRVNLFEKVLIPRARENIREIRVFLGDQELSAVCRAKVAKGKIEAAKAGSREAFNAY